MPKIATQYNEGILMKLHKFVIGNCLGIRDACHLLDAVNKDKKVIYQIDFSDIHPYIFPGKTQKDIERDSQSYHGFALKYMWDSIFNFTDSNWRKKFNSLPFRLAMTPATRLETIESLWHAEKRIYKKFRKCASNIMPHIKFKKDHFILPDRTKLYEYMKSCDYKNFLFMLQEAVSDEALKQCLKGPVDSLTFLIESEVLLNLEEYLPSAVLYDIQQMDYPTDIICYTQTLYSHRSRSDKKRIWSREHDLFHDKVDELNINLAYSIAKAETAKNYYVPLLTHTGRLIRVGTQLMDYSNHLLVNHTLAPLYIIKAIGEYPREDLPSYFNFGKALIGRIAKEMRQIKELNELLELNYKDLNERIKEKRMVDINEQLLDKLKIFSSEYYNIIESASQKHATREAGERVIPQKITIDDIIVLLNKAVEATKEIRGTAGDLRDVFAEQNCALAGIFEPMDFHAKEISNWLIKKEDINLADEFGK